VYQLQQQPKATSQKAECQASYLPTCGHLLACCSSRSAFAIRLLIASPALVFLSTYTAVYVLVIVHYFLTVAPRVRSNVARDTKLFRRRVRLKLKLLIHPPPLCTSKYEILLLRSSIFTFQAYYSTVMKQNIA
jgi:hypothetical protein